MNFEYLKEHMDSLGETLRTPGRYIIVTHHGKRVFEFCAGYADEAKTKPFAADTLVNMYSCSKPFPNEYVTLPITCPFFTGAFKELFI